MRAPWSMLQCVVALLPAVRCVDPDNTAAALLSVDLSARCHDGLSEARVWQQHLRLLGHPGLWGRSLLDQARPWVQRVDENLVEVLQRLLFFLFLQLFHEYCGGLLCGLFGRQVLAWSNHPHTLGAWLLGYKGVCHDRISALGSDLMSARIED